MSWCIQAWSMVCHWNIYLPLQQLPDQKLSDFFHLQTKNIQYLQNKNEIFSLWDQELSMGVI